MAIEDSFGLSLPEPAGPATGLVAACTLYAPVLFRRRK
jgi:hypothetical protein